MSGYWQKKAIDWAKRARDLALTVLVIGGVQVALSLVPWLAFFRSHPQGFSMALSLVGFAGWFVAFASSIGGRRGASMRGGAPRGGSMRETAPPAAARQSDAAGQPSTGLPQMTHPLAARFQERFERSGCGTVLFLSSLLPLALAFVLRLQADLQSGKTWGDIFPTMP